MTKLIESLDSLIVEAEALQLGNHTTSFYALNLCLVHLRCARTILNSFR